MSDRPNVAKIVRENMDQLQAEIEERKREAGSYESLLHARREAYQESGVPISKDEATDLVRRHSALPPYSDEKLDQEALQEHFDNRDTEFNMLIMRALRSVEDVAEIEEMAEVDPLFFDALLRAATIVFNPEYDHLYFPTKERLFRWFKDVGNGRISRPTRHKRGRNPYKNLLRDVFFHQVVQDLMSCGLAKITNEATDKTTPSACGVVAEFWGLLEADAVRKAVDRVEKLSSETE